MAIGLEREYQLRWMDFDRYGRIQPAAVLDIFQDLATIQANDMGIGRDKMMEEGVFWAVVRMKYEMVREPQHHQLVTCRTWPHTPTRFSFLRDYTMRDEDGQLLIKASSEWVLMDATTRKFASVKDFYKGSDDFHEERAFEKKPKKILAFEPDPALTRTMAASYTDIDVNGHVNNAMYANFVVNALNPGEDGAIRTFQIDYRKEVLPEVPFDMELLIEDGLIRARGVNDEGDVSFTCAIELQ